MAETSDKIMDMVRRELAENPDVNNAVLYEKAQEVDPDAMRDLDRRQFHARYPLRVKRFELQRPKKSTDGLRPRRRSRKKDAPTPSPAGALREPGREGLRDILLRFAQDLANAETHGEIVKVVAGVDTYVEQIRRLHVVED